MFAEESIYGTTDVVVEAKGRVCISKLTKATKDDNLVLVKTEDMIKVCKEEDINELIDKLNELLITETDEVKIAKINQKLHEIYVSVVKKCVVDAQGRINCSGIFEPHTPLKIIGAKNSIYLKPAKALK